MLFRVWHPPPLLEINLRAYLFLSTREDYRHTFIVHLVMGNTNTCVYQFVIYDSNENSLVITRFFIMDVLGLCVSLKYYVEHMLYRWNFSR